jgi:hypothetical protein
LWPPMAILNHEIKALVRWSAGARCAPGADQARVAGGARERLAAGGARGHAMVTPSSAGRAWSSRVAGCCGPSDLLAVILSSWHAMQVDGWWTGVQVFVWATSTTFGPAARSVTASSTGANAYARTCAAAIASAKRRKPVRFRRSAISLIVPCQGRLGRPGAFGRLQAFSRRIMRRSFVTRSSPFGVSRIFSTWANRGSVMIRWNTCFPICPSPSNS